jgi:DNA-binding NtrC family response regulator
MADPGLISEVKRILDGSDFEIVMTDTPKTAIRIIESDQDIDVVLIEPLSGENAGLQVVRYARASHRNRLIPILAVGQHFDADTVRSFLSLEVNDIAVMPLEQESFRARLYKLNESGRPTVLVVDDEPALREFLEDLLMMERYRVFTANSAKDALTQIEQKKIDVVVSDIVMPGKSGFDLLVEIKDKYPKIPVILITGFSGKHSPQDIIAAGADGYFVKPFHNAELTYTLRRVLESGIRMRPTQPAAAR